MPAPVRETLTSGTIDPRIVNALADLVVNHSVTLASVQTPASLASGQVVEIIAVDGERVSLSNIGARDLVGDLAAIDPSGRPTSVTSPWAISAPGFASDPAQPASIQLTFAPAGSTAPASSLLTAPEPTLPQAASPAAFGAVRSHDAPAPITPASPGVADQAAGPAHASTPCQTAPPQPPAAPGAPAHPAAAAHGYVSPLPATARIGRTDMGVDVDLNPGDPIVAPGDSRVLGIMPNWYQGQPYVALQLLDGPKKGRNYYIAEQINVAVTPGQIIKRGDVIAHYAASGSGIEIGWAGPNWEQTLAQATGSPGSGDHSDAPAGVSFRAFLQSLAPAGSTGAGAGGHSAAASAAPTPGASPTPPAPPPVSPPRYHTVQFRVSQAGASQTPTPGAGQVVEAAVQTPAHSGAVPYPGDSASPSAIARWMADEAQRRGLPRELPVMASLVESGLHNLPGGDRDSVGYFQMRTGIWDRGPYAGFPNNPRLQLDWFLDQASGLKQDATTDPSQYGNWIADVERPAAQYRYRYQLRLEEARQLLGEG